MQGVSGPHRRIPVDRLPGASRPLRPTLGVGVDLEHDARSESRILRRDAVVEATVASKDELLSCRNLLAQADKGALDAFDIGPAGDSSRLSFGFATWPPAPAMRSRIDVVDVPGSSTDRGSDAQRMVLPGHEGLKVIVDDRLVDLRA